MVPQLSNFTISFNMGQPSFNMLKGTIPIINNLDLTNVQNETVKQGTYTPNNDYIWMWQDIPAAQAPNFIFIMSPGMFNITVGTTTGTICNSIPCNKQFVLFLPPASTCVINEIYFEGRTNVPLPMAQGIPVDFFAVMAQATF